MLALWRKQTRDAEEGNPTQALTLRHIKSLLPFFSLRNQGRREAVK